MKADELDHLVIQVPPVESETLCWAIQHPHELTLAPVRCTRAKGHTGPHSWEVP